MTMRDGWRWRLGVLVLVLLTPVPVLELPNPACLVPVPWHCDPPPK